MYFSPTQAKGLALSIQSGFRKLQEKLREKLRGTPCDGPVNVPEPVSQLQSVGSRIVTTIDGAQLVFSSSDIVLRPAAEAIGSALLIPAMHARRQLVIHARVNDTWSQNIAAIPPLVRSWWNYPATAGDLQLQPASQPAERHNATALAFSCGVDSFYSLLRYSNPLGALVSVHGYDVKLHDRRRLKSLSASVRTIAAELALRPIIISTNLRRIGLMKHSPWERTHGGALAAIGHLLSDSYGTFIVSSSVSMQCNSPWGSHWELDPKFSSEAMRIEHFGEMTPRLNKLTEIADEPIVRKHLRVCWEYRNNETNCGLCEKCIRTMLTLDACSQLGHFPSFANKHRLADSIARCPYFPKTTFPSYLRIQQLGVSDAYQAPLRLLIERSIAHHGQPA